MEESGQAAQLPKLVAPDDEAQGRFCEFLRRLFQRRFADHHAACAWLAEVYEQQTAWPVVIERSQLVVFWGADPMITNQIGWVCPDHGAYPGLEASRQAVRKLSASIPCEPRPALFFDAEWIAPRPQTDVALMLGIAHTLKAEKLQDERS